MPPVLPYAVAALAALAFISSADSAPAPGAPEGAVVRTHVRWGLFATTEPAITTVRFPAATAGSDGWTEADPAHVSSEGDLSHAITVAEITPCVARALPSDDSAGRTLVQWSSDNGAHWQDLTNVPVVASAVEQAGNHPGAMTLRYRARAAAESCTLRVVYTAVPAR